MPAVIIEKEYGPPKKKDNPGKEEGGDDFNADAEIEREAMATMRGALGADVAEAVGAYVKACVRMGAKEGK